AANEKKAEADKTKAEAEKATEEAVQNWLLKAHLFTVQFRFDDAEKAYQEAIDTDPESVDANFAFATFHANLNHYGKATRAYARCLELAKRSENRVDIALMLNNLAILDQAQNRMKAARKEYDEALNIFRELAQKKPDAYFPQVAVSLNNLSVLDRDQNRMEAARKEYEEALNIFRELAQKEPDTYLPNLAATLNNLANLDKDQNRMEAARKGFEKALKIRRELAQKNPD